MKLPLAEKLRPASLTEVIGQEHLIGKEGWITRIIESGSPLSFLLWGPPGCGKTTIAKLYAKAFSLPFFSVSAVSQKIADLKKMIQDVQEKTPLFHSQIILFIDEIHRFNKAQQDVFLPLIEQGNIILIGATTENPSFSLNNALLSRLHVLEIHPLEEQALSVLLKRVETLKPLPLTEEAKSSLVALAHGDARHLLNMVESVSLAPAKPLLDAKEMLKWVQKRAALYDKSGDFHYNLISALHKSIRGSDPDAALYWLARMIHGGEDLQYLARRLIRTAIEDIGLADPEALTMALNGWRTYEQLGSPEADLALAQVVIYLALAPKSNSGYAAFSHALKKAKETSHLSPPKHILNAPTKLMKQLDYGKDYQYDHDTDLAFSGQEYFPEEMSREEFYHPKERGFEREMKKRLDYFKKLRKKNPPVDSE